MAQTMTSQLGANAIASPATNFDPNPAPYLHHLESKPQTVNTQVGGHAIAPPQARTEDNTDLDFDDLPPFPKDVPTAPLLRIELCKLLGGDEAEIDRLWRACCDLGFFYLDLRDRDPAIKDHVGFPEHEELIQNVWKEHQAEDAPVQRETTTGSMVNESLENGDVPVDGEGLLADAKALFKAGQQFFDLPVEEKVKYDWSSINSYFGYKGYGEGMIDSKGTKDRNEFYNVCSTTPNIR